MPRGHEAGDLSYAGAAVDVARRAFRFRPALIRRRDTGFEEMRLIDVSGGFEQQSQQCPWLAPLAIARR